MASDQETLSRLADGELRELLRLLDGTDIEELELEVSGTRLFFKRQPGSCEADVGSSQPAAIGAAGAPESTFVVAERVGFFHYPADATSAPLKPGDLVTAGQVLGVIDSLSVPIPLQAPCAGQVDEVLVEDAQPVEFGQPLFVIQAAEDH